MHVPYNESRNIQGNLVIILLVISKMLTFKLQVGFFFLSRCRTPFTSHLKNHLSYINGMDKSLHTCISSFIVTFHITDVKRDNNHNQ